MKIKKQLALTLIMVVIGALLIGGGTFAYFSSTVSSDNNQFVAGSIKLNNGAPALGAFNVPNMKPTDTSSQTFAIDPAGTTLGANVTAAFTYTVPTTGVDLATQLEVTSLMYGTTDLLTQVADSNANGIKDLADLRAATNLNLGTIDGASTAKNFVINVEFHDTGAAQNEYQGKTLTGGTFTFTARQN